MSPEPAAWNGQHLGPGPVSLALHPPGDGPAASAVVAADAGCPLAVPVGRLGSWLAAHGESLFVSEGVAGTHRRLVAALAPLPGGAEAIRMLWDMLAVSRWIDLANAGRLTRFAAAEGGPDRAQAHPDPLAAARDLGRGLRALAGEATEPVMPEIWPGGIGRQRRRRKHPDTGVVGTDHPAYPLAAGGSDTRAGVAFANPAELTLDRERARNLCDAAEEAYRAACADLDRPGQRECFEWGGDRTVRRDEGGYPLYHRDPLLTLLRQANEGLCGLHNEPAPIARDAKGSPPADLEQWGVWAACDPFLWAWREAQRAAGVSRLARGAGPVRPRYETLPCLRSVRPNLVAYRRVGVPAFVPRPGHVFAACRIDDLRARCFAAVSVNAGYSVASGSRLFNAFWRGEGDPLYPPPPGAAAGLDPIYPQALELYAASRGERAEGSAWQGFEALRAREEDEYRAWIRRTRALLEVAPLGLPDRLSANVLRLEYGLDEITEPVVRREVELLARHVAYELAPFLADGADDIHAARSGRTGRDVDLRRSRLEPGTAGGWVRNKAVRDDDYSYRSETLGGRFTPRSDSACVRQTEVLMAADEVVVEVAFLLSRAGLSPNVAGSEFVIEVPEQKADEARGHFSSAVRGASRRILGGMPLPTRVDFVTAW